MDSFFPHMMDYARASMNTKYFLIRLKFVLLSMIAKVGGNSDSTAFRVRSRNLGFSLSYYHQNLSTNKVKNQREKSRWIFKQFSKDSGLCHASCGRNSKKCFAQIYKVMYGRVCRGCMATLSLCPSEGHKYGDRKVRKMYFNEFAIKSPWSSFEGS